MGKKIKRKAPEMVRRYTFQGAAAFCRLAIPQTDGAFVMRKPRESLRADFLNATPQLHHALTMADAINAGREVEVEEVAIPGREIVALAQYLADHTIAIEAIAGPDGLPLSWDAMRPDERLDLYETLPADALMVVYGQYLGHIAIDHNPQLVDKMIAAAEG